MAKFLGDKASFSFASTVYQCLTNYSWSGSVQEAVSRCSSSAGAVTHRNVGAPDDSFTFDVIVDAGDFDTIDELKRGSSGAFEFHPEGDTANNIEFDATSSYVTASSLAGGVDAHGILSITIGIDGTLTVRAAS